MDDAKETQASIDAMFERDGDFRPVYQRICEYAKRGMEKPGSLTAVEIQQVCYALVIHYAQMGIG